MRRHRRRGNALVEFALGASALTLLMLGTFRFGYTFYVYDQLQSAVRNGARYASMRPYRTTAAGSPCAQNIDAVKYMTVYGEPVTDMGSLSATGYQRAKGLALANVSVVYTPSTGVQPTEVEVRITNFTINGVVGSTTLTNKPFAKLPFMGPYAYATCP